MNALVLCLCLQIMPFSNQENIAVIQVPDPTNVNIIQYRRRRNFCSFVFDLYELMRCDPNYRIMEWFPVVYTWALTEARKRNPAILDKMLFVNCFYHGVALFHPQFFLALRPIFSGDNY